MRAPLPIHDIVSAVEALIARLGLAHLASREGTAWTLVHPERRRMAVIAVVPRHPGSLMHCRAVATFLLESPA